MTRALTVLMVLFSALLCSCSGWERKMVFRGSSPGTSVEIQQPFPANGWGIRVMLASKGNVTTLYQLRGDVFLDFADVAWSPDDTAVAVFTCGTPPLRIGYSLASSTFLPFKDMQAMAEAHIRGTYRSDMKGTSDTDTFDWACSSMGKEAFLRRHPGASPR